MSTAGQPISQDLRTPPHADSQVDVFDRADLFDRCLGNEAFAGKIVRKYLDRFPGDLEELKQAVDSEEQLEKCAHRLKGAAASVGARRLEGLLTRIESRQASDLPTSLGELESEWRQFFEVADRFLAGTDDPQAQGN